MRTKVIIATKGEFGNHDQWRRLGWSRRGDTLAKNITLSLAGMAGIDDIVAHVKEIVVALCRGGCRTAAFGPRSILRGSIWKGQQK